MEPHEEGMMGAWHEDHPPVRQREVGMSACANIQLNSHKRKRVSSTEHSHAVYYAQLYSLISTVVGQGMNPEVIHAVKPALVKLVDHLY